MRTKPSAVMWRAVLLGLGIATMVLVVNGFSGGSWPLKILGAVVGGAAAAGIFWMTNARSAPTRD